MGNHLRPPLPLPSERQVLVLLCLGRSGTLDPHLSMDQASKRCRTPVLLSVHAELRRQEGTGTDTGQNLTGRHGNRTEDDRTGARRWGGSDQSGGLQDGDQTCSHGGERKEKGGEVQAGLRRAAGCGGWQPSHIHLPWYGNPPVICGAFAGGGGCTSPRLLLSVRPTPRGGGSGRISGWVGVQPPPPPPGWGGTLWGPLGLSSQCHFFLSSVAGSM